MIAQQYISSVRELLAEHLQHHPRVLAHYQTDSDFYAGTEKMIMALAAMSSMLRRRQRTDDTDLRELILGTMAELLNDASFLEAGTTVKHP